MNLNTILLVEDDPNDVELTLEALSQYKLVNTVVVINDGSEALDYLHYRGKYKGRTTKCPMVVLLDLKMPKVDGLEVLRHIKSDPQLKPIPVVMLTFSVRKDCKISPNCLRHR
ncbi:MAG: response regulator [bacterium]|nr:response regulator [bacterium]